MYQQKLFTIWENGGINQRWHGHVGLHHPTMKFSRAAIVSEIYDSQEPTLKALGFRIS